MLYKLAVCDTEKVVKRGTSSVLFALTYREDEAAVREDAVDALVADGFRGWRL